MIGTGFSKLSLKERYERLVKNGLLTQEEVSFLQSGGVVENSLMENFIENVIGSFQIPLGVAVNFRIDGIDRVIPMAVEETSIIAAASKTAKWVRECGEINTVVLGQNVIGQIQMSSVKHPDDVKKKIIDNKSQILEKANQIAVGLVKRGGGVKDLKVRILNREDTEKMVVIHLLIDPCDAMGANIINQVCESLKPLIESITGVTVNMCILSNLVDTKLVKSEVILRKIDAALGSKIEEASRFAEKDPYRAATNNKGILNGIDPVLIATGNDWRAVEAGIHAYASRSGQYSSLSKWRYDKGTLRGEITAPIAVGTVGGVIGLHPTAKICLKILGVKNAETLSRILVSVGLVQNLGALHALSTVGIVAGHMKLHATNLALAAGANSMEVKAVKERLEEYILAKKNVSLKQAMNVLDSVRETLNT